VLTDWNETNILYRGPYIDATYQVSVHLTKRFQRRGLKCEKLTAKAQTAFRAGELTKF